MYPDGPCTVLRQALAQKFSLPERMVVISNGADNLILMIANAFVDEGDEVVMADPTFPVYTNVTQIMGGKVVKVKLKDFTHDLDGMLKKVNRKTKLVFICNPNNPTGTTVSQKSFNHFLSKLPERVIAVLDEAYGDFVEDPFYPNGLDYVKARRQVDCPSNLFKGLRISGPKNWLCLRERGSGGLPLSGERPFSCSSAGPGGCSSCIE